MALTTQTFNPLKDHLEPVRAPTTRNQGALGYTTATDYFKYIEAERKISRNERIIRNVDKKLRHARGYPHSLNSGADVFGLKTTVFESKQSVLGPP